MCSSAELTSIGQQDGHDSVDLQRTQKSLNSAPARSGNLAVTRLVQKQDDDQVDDRRGGCGENLGEFLDLEGVHRTEHVRDDDAIHDDTQYAGQDEAELQSEWLVR